MMLFWRLAAVILTVSVIFIWLLFLLNTALTPLVGDQREILVLWISVAVALLCAIGAGWFVWVNFTPGHRSALSSTILGAILFGSFCFAVPLFYVLIGADSPVALQVLPFALVFSMIIIGPLGFAVGGIAGFLYWLIRGRKPPA